MRRRVLLCLTLITVSACNGDNVIKPTASPTPPSKDISDATHTGLSMASNPDFFFLPPMVKDASGDPLWNAGAFNASLHPTVEICALVAADTAQATAAPCASSPTVYNATLDAAAEQYRVNWKVPTSPTTFYRITVKVGAKKLGFADVKTGANGSQLKNVATNDFIPLVDGSTLPIKFRIERFALCDDPLAGGCSSSSGDIAIAPITVLTGTPESDGISSAVGVTIPAQNVPTSTPITVTIASCPNLNPRVIDLPTFGECVRVTTDPALTAPLSTPATVFVCAVGISASLFTGLSEEQEARVTMHRYDATPQPSVTALPHAPACTPNTPGGVASLDPSLGGMLASLAHGQFRRAATQAVALVTPKPLYAAMFIDLGGGGFTDAFSDFQFALPAKMEVVPGTDNQTALTGATLSPAVKVTDLGGSPVAGASVHFNFPSGDVTVTTGANGLASRPWTIGEGGNSLPVSGRGIASLYVNGPRGAPGPGDEFDSVFDPFQPIQNHFDPTFTGQGQPVPVYTGTLAFSATGVTPTASATASVSPASYSGACPVTFTFTGVITSTVAGDVSYRWDRSDGAGATATTLHFSEPGSQTVTDTWTLSPDSFSGWERVRITAIGTVDVATLNVVSNTANFTLTCTATPPPG